MIRLLRAESLTLQRFKDDDCPPYVILSHRWAEDPSDEVVYDDMANFHELYQSRLWKKTRSAAKILGACQQVLEEKINYLWVDTVCIKQDNPMKLSTAINSMYRLYSNAEVCLAYLADYPSAEVQTLCQSDWFNRGWTLQELVAPEVVKFFDKDWRSMGERRQLSEELTHRTRIAKAFLVANLGVGNASISERMSWIAGRKTSVPEDTAYCLLGIFSVNMPLLYGEGKERAFLRLQEEIMRYSDDHSLFVWKTEERYSYSTGLLASSPDCFRSTGNYSPYYDDPDDDSRPYQMTNKGIAIDLHVLDGSSYDACYPQMFSGIGILNCSSDVYNNEERVGVYLRKVKGSHYCRVWPHKICQIKWSDRGEKESIYVKHWDGRRRWKTINSEGQWV
ncbi:MAG: hypothetical protein L6R36_004882 [Xanthoria steineri]|nr:MAG: hypothetical protein L6R36_004882 [Xanthoria steineri]